MNRAKIATKPCLSQRSVKVCNNRTQKIGAAGRVFAASLYDHQTAPNRARGLRDSSLNVQCDTKPCEIRLSANVLSIVTNL